MRWRNQCLYVWYTFCRCRGGFQRDRSFSDSCRKRLWCPYPNCRFGLWCFRSNNVVRSRWTTFLSCLSISQRSVKLQRKNGVSYKCLKVSRFGAYLYCAFTKDIHLCSSLIMCYLPLAWMSKYEMLPLIHKDIQDLASLKRQVEFTNILRNYICQSQSHKIHG